MEPMVGFDQLLDSWKTVRLDTAEAVEAFPADELDFKAAPDMMRFGDIAYHILVAGHGLTGLLLDGEDLTGPQFREKLMKHAPLAPGATAAELAGALRASVEERVPQLAAKTPEFYEGMVTRVDGARVTRMEMLQFVKEHELTHRAQLFVCLRMMFVCLRMKGIVPSTTRKRLARQAAR
jgi:uncharacterized damage-inducible protein DinB